MISTNKHLLVSSQLFSLLAIQYIYIYIHISNERWYLIEFGKEAQKKSKYANKEFYVIRHNNDFYFQQLGKKENKKKLISFCWLFFFKSLKKNVFSISKILVSSIQLITFLFCFNYICMLFSFSFSFFFLSSFVCFLDFKMCLCDCQLWSLYIILIELKSPRKKERRTKSEEKKNSLI